MRGRNADITHARSGERTYDFPEGSVGLLPHSCWHPQSHGQPSTVAECGEGTIASVQAVAAASVRDGIVGVHT